jgi:F-type H+-transporting ATPase subunit b
MVGILNLTLFRPINKVLDERDRETKGRRKEARDLVSRIEAGLRQYQRALKEARAAAYLLLEQERAKALGQREEKLALLRDEIRSLVAEQKAEIEGQTHESKRALDVESMTSAAEISARILRRRV